ncbi:MAG: NifU family protein [Alphaproteobacteria bacterium]
MFIQTETTPNPATLKFLPGREVLAGAPRDYRSREDAKNSPLALQLFAVEGVSAVFLAEDFITVTRMGPEWQHLKPAVLGAIMDFFLSGAPVVEFDPADASVETDEEFFESADAQTVATIKELLETRVRPAVAQDGGDIVFRGFRDGVVFLHMRGACAGCPSSTMTLKHGIENLLRHFLPDVSEVRPI